MMSPIVGLAEALRPASSDASITWARDSGRCSVIGALSSSKGRGRAATPTASRLDLEEFDVTAVTVRRPEEALVRAVPRRFRDAALIRPSGNPDQVRGRLFSRKREKGV